MFCKNCREQIGDYDAECPRCGEATGNQPQSHYLPPQNQQYQQQAPEYQQPNFDSQNQQSDITMRQVIRLLFEGYLAVYKKYIDFSGRARRAEYWLFYFCNMIIGFIFYLFYFIGLKLHSNMIVMIVSLLILIFGLVVLLPGIAVTVRRLHDVGKSGLWYFITLVPCIGGLWLLILLVTAGTAGSNQYGFDPKND